MASFMRSRPDARIYDPASVPPRRARPSAAVASEAGPMLPFGATMDLLAAAGVPVAPYHLVRGMDDAARYRSPAPTWSSWPMSRTGPSTARSGSRVTAGQLGAVAASSADLAAGTGCPSWSRCRK